MTDAVYNDQGLVDKLKPVLEQAIGKDNLVTEEPITASEDFSAFLAEKIPGLYLSLGGADPQKLRRRKAPARICRRTIPPCLRRTRIRRCIPLSPPKLQCCGHC